EENRLAHDPILGPLAEVHFADSFGLHPMHRSVGRWLDLKGTGRLNERFQHAMDLAKQLFTEACAHVTHVNQLLALVNTQQQRSKIFTATARIRKTSNHGLLTLLGLDLEPRGTSSTGLISA